MGIIGSSQFKVNDKFFDKLGDKVKRIADEEAKKMAVDMHFILKNRFPLKGGNGRYPKYDKKTVSMGEHSHKGWRLQQRANGEYWVANYHENSSGFNYTKILATGKGWSQRVMDGAWSRLSVGTKANGVFSTQMPNGLAPWLKIKRGDMEERVMSRVKKDLKGGIR